MPVEVSLNSEQQESDKNDPQANTKLQPMQGPSNFFEKKASAAGGEHSASSREQMSVTSTWCGSQRHYHHHDLVWEPSHCRISFVSRILPISTNHLIW